MDLEETRLFSFLEKNASFVPFITPGFQFSLLIYFNVAEMWDIPIILFDILIIIKRS